MESKLPSYSELKNYKDTSTDFGYQSYVGWEHTSQMDDHLKYLYSVENLSNLQKIITKSLEGVHPDGKDIIVPLNEIASSLSNIFENANRTNIGDIHTRYIVPQETPRNDCKTINEQTIQAIVSLLRTQFQVEKNNKKLTVWNTLYGDFNKEGLRAYPPIKLRNKHPQYMAFNMNY
jgi:hypothetical protein